MRLGGLWWIVVQDSVGRAGWLKDPPQSIKSWMPWYLLVIIAKQEV
jgi:hypothetical protein